MFSKIFYFGEWGVIKCFGYHKSKYTEFRWEKTSKILYLHKKNQSIKPPEFTDCCSLVMFWNHKWERWIQVATTPTQSLKSCHLCGILRWQTFNSHLCIACTIFCHTTWQQHIEELIWGQCDSSQSYMTYFLAFKMMLSTVFKFMILIFTEQMCSQHMYSVWCTD